MSVQVMPTSFISVLSKPADVSAGHAHFFHHLLSRRLSLQLLLLLCSPAISLGFTIYGEIFAYVIGFSCNHSGSLIPSSWMVRDWCVFVADIHPSRTWMSGSVDFAQWNNACVHRPGFGLYSHPRVLGEWNQNPC